ncbi:uncharacterized protein LOC113869276 [Abrus precatorius]|uniref:Uncharacterized protein LOC113869276 n=1 Tax=Abrus precatorius TaxID=3816 RepID=A0A8B8M2A3_ABRPR|nr:uncharacterized protein LOC113869276 [Abrus precatorius]
METAFRSLVVGALTKGLNGTEQNEQVTDNEAELAEYRGISSFTRHNPPKFEGKFDLEEAQRWIADVEKIFHVIKCTEEHKVTYATYMQNGEAEDRYWPHYQHDDGEADLCAQFEHGLRPYIRAAISVFQLTNLPTLVSKCRIFEANTKGKTVDTIIGGPVRRPLKSFNCSGSHIKRNCPQLPLTCDICGKMGHSASVCWSALQKSRNMSVVQRPESRTSTGTKPNVEGKVFAMSGVEASKSDELIRGKCIIKD